jgi:hypothetical protein
VVLLLRGVIFGLGPAGEAACWGWGVQEVGGTGIPCLILYT